MKENGNSEARILENPCLKQIPVLRTRPGTERIAHSREFVQKGVGAETTAGDLFGQGFIDVVLVDDRRNLEGSEGGQRPSAFQLRDLLFNGHLAQQISHSIRNGSIRILVDRFRIFLRPSGCPYHQEQAQNVKCRFLHRFLLMTVGEKQNIRRQVVESNCTPGCGL